MVALYTVNLPPGALGVELGSATAGDILDRRSDVFAALDGPMFDAQGPQYALRDKARGIEVSSRFPTRGVIFCVVAGRAAARRGGMPMAGSTVCVQTYPSLIEAGSVTVTGAHDAELVGRAAIALRRDGTVTLIAARAASMIDFARSIQSQLDPEWCGYTDGGSSTALVARGNPLLNPRNLALPSWIVARQVAEPPKQNDDDLLAAGAAVVGGAVLYWIFDRGSRRT